jgi:hypothetical protein
MAVDKRERERGEELRARRKTLNQQQRFEFPLADSEESIII